MKPIQEEKPIVLPTEKKKPGRKKTSPKFEIVKELVVLSFN
jgi:hypothetical protein